MPKDPTPLLPGPATSNPPTPWWLRPVDSHQRAEIEKKARPIIELPGFWHRDEQEIPGGEGTVVKPRYLRRLDPGAPLPDVDPGASRFEVVVERLPATRWQPFLAAAGGLMAAGGVTALLNAGYWGGLVTVLGVSLVGSGLDRPYTIAVRRSETGRWVEAPGVIEKAKPSPLVSGDERAGALFAAVLAAGLAAVSWGTHNWLGVLGAVAVGLLMIGVTFIDRLPIPRTDPSDALRTRLRFYALADPTLPLAEDEPLPSARTDRPLPDQT